MGMQGITELFHPWARKSFYWMPCIRQKVFEKIQGIRHWYLQNTACTNFATEKVSVLASPGKVKDEEVGIRMFSLSQMTKAKLVCALAWRENFAKGNNSVTDTIRRMQGSHN